MIILQEEKHCLEKIGDIICTVQELKQKLCAINSLEINMNLKCAEKSLASVKTELTNHRP